VRSHISSSRWSVLWRAAMVLWRVTLLKSVARSPVVDSASFSYRRHGWWTGAQAT